MLLVAVDARGSNLHLPTCQPTALSISCSGHQTELVTSSFPPFYWSIYLLLMTIDFMSSVFVFLFLIVLQWFISPAGYEGNVVKKISIHLI